MIQVPGPRCRTGGTAPILDRQSEARIFRMARGRTKENLRGPTLEVDGTADLDSQSVLSPTRRVWIPTAASQKACTWKIGW